MDLNQVFAGGTRYLPELHLGPHRLFVAVTCRIGPYPRPVEVLLDTASEWCVLQPELTQRAGCDLDGRPGDVVLSSRLGRFEGGLERVDVVFPADLGRDVRVEATFFVSPDWPGPTVIGWKGCLERMRFALDPSDETFYFAELFGD